MSAQAVGGLIGGALIGYASRRLATVRLLGIGSILFGALDLVLFNYPLVMSGFAAGLVLIALVGIPAIAMGAGFTTLLQETVRDAYRGRIFGMLGTTSALLMLAGTLIGGTVGGAVSPIALLTVQGGSYIAVGILALLLLPPALAAIGEEHEQPALAEPLNAR
jgi:MFS family permease